MYALHKRQGHDSGIHSLISFLKVERDAALIL